MSLLLEEQAAAPATTDAGTVVLSFTVSALETREITDAETGLLTFTVSSLETREIADSNTVYLDLQPAGDFANVALNGLAVDYDPPGGTDSKLFLNLNPTAQTWQPSHDYAVSAQINGGSGYDANGYYATIIPTAPVDPALRFATNNVGSGFSGSSEPTGAQQDNDISWTVAANPYKNWAALTAYSANDIIVVSGYAVLILNNGTSGSAQPNWASFDYGATIVSGGLFMAKVGPVTAWAANTKYTWLTNSGRGQTFAPHVTLSGTAGMVLEFTQGVGAFYSSGAVEPSWAAVTVPGGDFYIDGEIAWHAGTYAIGGYTIPEKLVVTGLKAPSVARTIRVTNSATGGQTLVLADETVDYGTAAQSAAANRFSFGGTSITLTAGQSVNLAYNFTSSRWEALVPGFVDSGTVGFKFTLTSSEAAQNVDAGTLNLVLTPSSVEIRERVDSATLAFVLTPSTTAEVIVDVDSATVRVAFTPGGTDQVSGTTVDVNTLSLGLIPTSSEVVQYVESATAAIRFTPTSAEIAQFVDSSTLPFALSPSGTEFPARETVDAGTADLRFTPTSADIAATVDSAVNTLNLTPSAVELRERVDTATTTLKFTPNSVDTAQLVDANTVNLVFTPNSAELALVLESATTRLSLTPASIDVKEGAGVDATTLRLVLAPSTTDIAQYVDVASAKLTFTPSTADVFTGLDTSTADLRFTVSSADVPIFVDVGTGSLRFGITGLDEPTRFDVGSINFVLTPDTAELAEYVDSDIIYLLTTPDTLEGLVHQDAATVMLTLQPEGAPRIFMILHSKMYKIWTSRAYREWNSTAKSRW